MIVLVPSTIALLPSYAGLEDPIASLRAAAESAVARLAASGSVALLTADARPDNVSRGVSVSPGARIGRALLSGFTDALLPQADGILAVANGSACRSEKAPGHLDERAAPFDEALGRALHSGDGAALARLDASLAEELWCFDAPVFRAIGPLVDGLAATVSYDDDPYGVQYWVATWT